MPKYVPTLANALLIELARLLIPDTAANATRASIKTYSTRPWPDSSFQSRIKQTGTVTRVIFCSIQRNLRFASWLYPQGKLHLEVHSSAGNETFETAGIKLPDFRLTPQCMEKNVSFGPVLNWAMSDMGMQRAGPSAADSQPPTLQSFQVDSELA